MKIIQRSCSIGQTRECSHHVESVGKESEILKVPIMKKETELIWSLDDKKMACCCLL